jgi:DNA-binding CsgD family transcriptional regulator
MATTRQRRSRRRTLSTPVELTEKQKEVVTLAEEGLTIDQAAARMKIAASGVYNHVRKIREKGIEVTFAKATNGGESPSMDDILGSAATNGGGTADAGITEAARAALSKDATEYLTALDTVKQECVNRKEEIAREIASLRAEDEALTTRIDKLAGRQAEAQGVVEKIEALTA